MRARRAVWRPGPRWGDQNEVLFFQLGRGEKAATRHVLSLQDGDEPSCD